MVSSLAARAGKHVLVEKPMARNRAEADAMVAAADAAKVKLADSRLAAPIPRLAGLRAEAHPEMARSGGC